MIIKKRRIRSLNSNIGHINPGKKFVIGVKHIERYEDILENLGFTNKQEIGESVLPNRFGPVSEYNAYGKYNKHEDRPMETAYRTIEWHWKEWAGRGRTVERSKLVDVPYERYPRTFIEPPSVEFTISSLKDGNKIITTPILEYNKNEKDFLHVINLFLEIFRECQLFTENLEEIIKPPIKRLNWEILPQGPMPWKQLSRTITPLINIAPKGNHPVIWHRIHTIERFNPDFHAFGKAGFIGYIVFGFEKKNLFIFESIRYGNATYIFDHNWKELSQKNKAEILDKNLQKARIIHRVNWENEIQQVFNDLGMSNIIK